MSPIEITESEAHEIRQLCDNYRQSVHDLHPGHLIDELVDLHGFDRAHPFCQILQTQESGFPDYRGLRAFIESVGVSDLPAFYEDDPAIAPSPSSPSAAAAAFSEPGGAGHDVNHEQPISGDVPQGKPEAKGPARKQNAPGGNSYHILPGIGAILRAPFHLSAAAFAKARGSGLSKGDDFMAQKIERLEGNNERIEGINRTMRESLASNTAIKRSDLGQVENLALLIGADASAVADGIESGAIPANLAQQASNIIARSNVSLQATSELVGEVDPDSYQTFMERMEGFSSKLSDIISRFLSFGRANEQPGPDIG